jgi:rubrerythrin
MPAPIATVEEFYAHALAIEREAADRYEEFADYFNARGDDVLEGLCRSLAGLERGHHAQLAAASSRFTLPAIAAQDYRWLEGASPEAAAREALYRIASPRDLLEIALKAECRARDFFLWIAATASSLPVRQLASDMALEELEHVSWVRQALEYRTAGEANWDSLLKQGVGPGIVSPS